MSLQSTKSNQQIYITTSIPYVNATPHIGHALEFVQADVLARFHRLCGYEVRFQTGTDENASKNVLAAQVAERTTAELVAENAAHFQTLADRLQISYDAFIRTSSDRDHAAAVERFWQAAHASGDIYKKQYSGIYCVGCELFYSQAELSAGVCPVHGSKPEVVEEENYFFRLSRYESKLIDLIESEQLLIVPKTRKNEVLSFIRQGLRDFSISRAAERTNGWGILVPDDPGQVIYVWFDALINYISGLGYAIDGSDFQSYWTTENNATHCIGKDISRFHAVYWPAMLLSAGVPLPRKILVHGFISANGQKIAKSTGNVVDPVLLLEQYGVDALRYYLIRHVPTTGDANYTDGNFAQVYKSDLADQLGNLLQRVVRMLELYADGKIPEPGQYTKYEDDLSDLAVTLPQQIADAITGNRFHHAIAAIWTLINASNKYIVEIRPWDLSKELNKGDSSAEASLRTCLYTLAESLRIIGVGLRPFLPKAAAEICQRLGIGSDNGLTWLEQFEWGLSVPGTKVTIGSPLFPKNL